MVNQLVTFISYVFFILSIFASFIFIIIVWLSPQKIKTRITFTLFNLSIDAWVLTLFVYYKTTDLLTLNVIGRLNFVVIVLFSVFVYNFILNFPDVQYKINKYINGLLYTFSSILLFLIIFTPYISVREEFLHGIRQTVFGSLYFLFFIYFIFVPCLILYVLIRKYIRAEGTSRTQISYLFAALGLSSTVGVTTNIVLPFVFNDFSFQILGPLATTILLGIIFYTVIKHRFLDLRIVFSNILYVFILAFLSFVAIYAFYFVEVALFGNIASRLTMEVNLTLCILITIIGILVNRQVQRFLQQNIINTTYDIAEVMDAYINQTNDIVNMDEISRITFKALNYAFDAEFAAIIIKNKKEHRIYSSSEEKFNIDQFNEMNNQLFNLPKEMFLKDEINDEKGQYFMSEHRIEIIYNIKNATLVIGIKKNKSAYSIHDINLIKNIALTLNGTINRAFLYNDVLKFNENLQEKISKATFELRQKNDELTAAYEKVSLIARQERDILDIMGHELRTPATVVKMASYLLAEEVKGKEGRKQLSRIKNSIERLISLINTFINTAKLDNGKLEISKEQIFLKLKLKQSIEDNLIDAQDKGLELKFVDKGEVPVVQGDKNMLREVIDNLISNAIKYTEEGKIEVSCYVDKIQENVVVEIKDSGEGIKQEDMKNIFKKFRRLNNYTMDSEAMGRPSILRPGGTGLGLYVAEKIIELHKGKIWVESEIGKGSTFFFSIPIISENKS